MSKAEERIAAQQAELSDDRLAERVREMMGRAAARRPDLLQQARSVLEAKAGQLHVAADPAEAMRTIRDLLRDNLSVIYPSFALERLELRPHGRPSREEIYRAPFGLTGATAVAAENGAIVLAEEDGYGRVISNLPFTHICVTTPDKVVASLEDAMLLCRAYARFLLGRPLSRYVSVITGPSKTADIAFTLVKGMHGPKHVHVVLVDLPPSGRLVHGLPEEWFLS